MKKTIDRRSVVKTAAWSVPTITVAAAAPAFARSGTAPASVAWTSSGVALLDLGLLDATTGPSSLLNIANLSVLPSGPKSFTITNPTGQELKNVTATVAITFAGGLPVLSTKGYGVYSAHGDPTRVSNYSEKYVGIGLLGTYHTTQTLRLDNVPAGTESNPTLASVPLVFGLTEGGGLGISALCSYQATVTVYADGVAIGVDDKATITLPVGLNVL